MINKITNVKGTAAEKSVYTDFLCSSSNFTLTKLSAREAVPSFLEKVPGVIHVNGLAILTKNVRPRIAM
ncbi:hypothetical protein [Siminovitchia sp. 179-K 8D1 HS]|uniref:hypothetical protein n=1 Tax=Siminovitchia sp. 179-K 8D1 HS TaxID=3142385 RepID=UPI0039A2BA11